MKFFERMSILLFVLLGIALIIDGLYLSDWFLVIIGGVLLVAELIVLAKGWYSDKYTPWGGSEEFIYYGLGTLSIAICFATVAVTVLQVFAEFNRPSILEWVAISALAVASALGILVKGIELWLHSSNTNEKMAQGY